jgi:hypothetical protein
VVDPLVDTVEHGPFCVMPDNTYCYGRSRSFLSYATMLNGSHVAPEFADVDG